ncbi:flagellin biosynthesis protein FlgN [Eubacterium oxidoreducens]|uniref:FlgN protein n=1 Tax=Eubacterium oxidoreducens TaxID=1732 RepID=A0A1G6BRU4_EUBOX|nr:flagellin biosynthesis protein FlgN [Eubacterium oxidoreducens]SDB23374.1 hypothetical protein SAMN02910417_01736 [Eubacterium oxidoreducens]
MDKNYLEVMLQSLEKKNALLDKILEKSRQQEQDLNNPELSADDFNALVREKAGLIESLTRLDRGFQSVYNKIKAQLEYNRQQYKKEIAAMQHQIREIMDKSNAIQAQEARNKQLAQKKFSGIRDKVKQVRNSQKVVNQYYNNMMKVNYVDSQFLDSKK